MKLVLFDIETTGIDSVKHGIHQISGKIIVNGQVKETFDFKVRPKDDAVYDAAALEVGKVTKEQLLAYPTMREVHAKFVTMLDKYVNKYDKTDKFFLVGYNNAHFDNPFLRQWFVDNGNKYFGSYFWSNSFDCMVLATATLAEKRATMPDFKQATVAAALGVVIESEKLHDASYDIELCHAIYDKVCGKY
jgi:DNA polymerase-3 subunit epsilon